MKRHIISFILALSICISMLPSSLAADHQKINEINYNHTNSIELVREACHALSPEAKKIFLNSISSDHELLRYYEEDIDLAYSPKIEAQATRAASAADPLNILKRDIKRLNLPNPVTVTLLAVAATLAASAVEGPAPVGKISLALASASAVAVIAAYWSVVGPKFPDITQIFQRFLSNSVQSVQQAFQELKSNILKMVGTTTTSVVSYDIKKKTVTYNGVTYHCTTKASELSNKNRNKGTYYVTLRIGKMLFCDTSRTIDIKLAKAILLCNNTVFGTMAMNAEKAREAATPYLRHDPLHKPGGPGYFPHYHPEKAQRAHSWYLIK